MRVDERPPVFLVLEGTWSVDIEDNASVRPFIEGLCGVSGWEFFHRPFSRRGEIEAWAGRFGQLPRRGFQKIVYVACHGGAGKLWTPESRIPASTVLKVLAPIPQIVGVHLGCCDLPALAERKLIQRWLGGSTIAWVAAYRKTVPWLEGTVVDLLFWNWIFNGMPHGGEWTRLAPLQAARRMYEGFPLAQEIEFHVMARRARSREFDCSWHAWRSKSRR